MGGRDGGDEELRTIAARTRGTRFSHRSGDEHLESGFGKARGEEGRGGGGRGNLTLVLGPEFAIESK